MAARTALLVLLALVLAGCATAPVIEVPATPAATAPLTQGQRLFDIAALQLGAPYRLGGAGPDAFDCSGLVQFAHSSVGISVPRTAAAQRDAAQPVLPESMRVGDLLFFRMSGDKVDHVGIYDGVGHFLHAPGRGRGIERASFDAPWYRVRFVGAGRFWRDEQIQPAGTGEIAR